jgi:hypothetical protein
MNMMSDPGKLMKMAGKFAIKMAKKGITLVFKVVASAASLIGLNLSPSFSADKHWLTLTVTSKGNFVQTMVQALIKVHVRL